MPNSRFAIVFVTAFLCCAASAHAQNWSFDARKIALGNAGGADHPASRMIDEERPYRAIVLPFGLIQVLRNPNVFNPDSDEFDIVRSVEYAASPFHYIIGRDSGTSETGRRLSVDIRNATLSRDLNTYRGFAPRQQPTSEGLTHTTYGLTIPVVRMPGGGFHGIYVGAGPYLSMRTSANIDQQLIDILASDVDVYLPNSSFRIGLDFRNQMAAAFTGGYRGRYPLAGVSGERDGVYVALDYNFLLGFRYEDYGTALALHTDSQGLLVAQPFAGSLPLRPLLVESGLNFRRDHSNSGRGYAIDVGAGIVADRVELGFGVKGLANRIAWTGVERTTRLGPDLFFGRELISPPDVPVADVTVELPRDYRAYAGFRAGGGMFVGDVGRGFEGTSVHGGYEHNFGAIDLRGGALYSRERWQPTGGIGLNLGPRVSLDLAMFGTSANVERTRKAAIAVSLRFNQQSANP
jgi:hypothetical protein